MDAADLIGMLIETTIAASAAVLLVLVLRRILRRAFGPVVAYALWLLVPAAIIAVLLPAAAVPAAAVVVMAPQVATGATADTDVAAGVARATWLTALWMLGAAVLAACFIRQQRAFRRRLGRLRRGRDGLSRADSIAGLPAAIGLWQPLIVVPADFDTRYTPAQQRLMQAHERMHIRCGDLQVNALASALRCVFWFNPLLQLAVRHFRHDQELACDQRVIALHPGARREYGEAMLETRLALQPLPLGCHWAAFAHARSHPLKERIAMLKQPLPSMSRWLAGSAVVAAILVSSGIAAWAAQPHRVISATAIAIAPPAPPQAPMSPAPAQAPTPPAAPHAPAPPPAPPAPRSHAAHPLPAIAPPAPRTPPAPVLPGLPSVPAVPPAPPAPATTPAPPYPADALVQGISGKVLLVIDVDPQGTPAAVEVASSEPAGVFDQAAVEAARRWRFTPEVVNGQPVAGRVQVPIEFRAPAARKPPPAAPLPPTGGPRGT